LLLTVVALVGAVFSIPVGVLTDRTTRTRLLAGSIAAWAAATALSGAPPRTCGYCWPGCSWAS
jgi:predicted MFS family arabinose efflux permease